MTTTSKIKIKLGAIEVEYEGSETFLKEELPALLSAVSDLYQSSKIQMPQVGMDAELVNSVSLNGAAYPGDAGSNSGVTSHNGALVTGTTNAIAARLHVKSGPDLILAAAARLTLGESVNVFPRKQLIGEMRSASNYFKSSILKNMTASLHRLVKDGKLNEPSKDHYALTASCKADLEARLAG